MTSLPPGVGAALLAALLFGIGTPLAKLLLVLADPWLLAALLYLGSGLGLAVFRRFQGAPRVRLAHGETRWLVGAILSGGVIAPIFLMLGLSAMPASGASLLLNAEGVFTALLAWMAFKENVDRRILLGMAFIVAGACVLSWPASGAVEFNALWPTLAVLAACLAWGIDNNLTRKVALTDASWIAMVKGLAAGSTNLALALVAGVAWPGALTVGGAALVGFLSYGLSLMLFVVALRHLGTARTGAYFSVAPFAGAVAALVLLNEAPTANLAAGGVLMAIGVALHLLENHSHAHTHEAHEHEHEHVHVADDPHHQHAHENTVASGIRHTHRHHHLPLQHAHRHFPDSHHQHNH